jgi:hypothetical protein
MNPNWFRVGNPMFSWVRQGMAAGEEQQSYQDFKFPDEIDMKRCYLWQMV